MDVAGWLRGLDLGQYEQAFRENDIATEILPRLTAEDLIAIGVSSVGHRRVLLDAIAALASKAMPAGGERRQLSVMFCDLVGSTTLAARLDPEDLGGVMGAYYRCVSEIVGRYASYVAKYMGDGVLVYFGYPQAHEDDAERAVRAGLELCEAVSQLTTSEGATLALRVGIDTGLVVVGDLIGEGAAQEQAVLGETPNLAARLQTLAQPGWVVIGPGTHRLVAGLFDLGDLGIGEKVQAWQVVGERRLESRFAARSASGLTPFVGRQHELALLLDRFKRAKDGEGQVVLLSGEPGIGKSRLAHALLERLADEPHTRLRYYCSPFHVNTALYPIIEQLERAAAFEPDDRPDRKLDKLETLLDRAPNDMAEVAPLFAALLSIDSEGRYGPLNMPAQRQRELTIAALVDQLARLSARQPVLMVLEDSHWLDPSSTQLFERIIERVQTLPVLLLVTFRPEFTSAWTSRPYTKLLTLSRLGQAHGTEMIAQVTGGKALPEAILAQIWARTEGVPLFVEELTKSVLESGVLREASDRYVLSGPLPTMAIPPTLQDSLLARLDRLGSAKNIAQIGAALGREFSYELLAAVAQLPDSELQRAMEQLATAELVFCRGLPPEATYTFKHALVQDAAYTRLLKSRRRTLHGRIARALEERFPDTVMSRPELVAHHLTMADLNELAAPYWQRAGDLALRRSAEREALAHFSAALAVVMEQAETPDRDQRELGIRLGLGTAISLVLGPHSPEYADHYARAVTVGRRAGGGKPLFRALWGSWYNKLNIGQGEEALALANELVTVAQGLGDEDLLLEAHHSRWASSHLAGNHEVAFADTAKGTTLYDPARHHAHTYEYGGHDTGVCARVHHAMTLWLTGFPDRAARMAVEAVDLGRRLRHPESLSHAASWTAVVRQLLGEPAACRTLAELAQQIEREQGSGRRYMWPLLLGWVQFEEVEQSEGLLLMESAITHVRSSIRRFYLDYQLLVFAQEVLKSGAPQRALGVVEEALGYIEVSANRLYEAEAHRLKGACLVALTEGNAGEAEQWFKSGIAIAKRQGALSLALRSATSLAALWGSHGRRAAARELLAPVYGGFTEGYDTPDLKDAKTLLDELSG